MAFNAAVNHAMATIIQEKNFDTLQKALARMTMTEVPQPAHQPPQGSVDRSGRLGMQGGGGGSAGVAALPDQLGARNGQFSAANMPPRGGLGLGSAAWGDFDGGRALPGDGGVGRPAAKGMIGGGGDAPSSSVFSAPPPAAAASAWGQHGPSQHGGNPVFASGPSGGGGWGGGPNGGFAMGQPSSAWGVNAPHSGVSAAAWSVQPGAISNPTSASGASAGFGGGWGGMAPPSDSGHRSSGFGGGGGMGAADHDAARQHEHDQQLQHLLQQQLQEQHHAVHSHPQHLGMQQHMYAQPSGAWGANGHPVRRRPPCFRRGCSRSHARA
jgi:hypothetical protein